MRIVPVDFLLREEQRQRGICKDKSWGVDQQVPHLKEYQAANRLKWKFRELSLMLFLRANSVIKDFKTDLSAYNRTLAHCHPAKRRWYRGCLKMRVRQKGSKLQLKTCAKDQQLSQTSSPTVQCFAKKNTCNLNDMARDGKQSMVAEDEKSAARMHIYLAEARIAQS